MGNFRLIVLAVTIERENLDGLLYVYTYYHVVPYTAIEKMFTIL